jgi:gliding motility-associated protein GldL
MSNNQTKFDLWWNSPKMKRIIGAAYSLGASIVILGAMFKILHLNGGGTMLGIGMTVEAIIFALGVFDKPTQEIEWNKVFNIDGNNTIPLVNNNMQQEIQSKNNVNLNYGEGISDEDLKKLTQGIKNLTQTAEQLTSLTNVAQSSSKLAETLNTASTSTSRFVSSQETLNNATVKLQSSYQDINNGMELVEKNTKSYAGKVDDINRNLTSINSVYEIQLKNIQFQSESLTKQTDAFNQLNADLKAMTSELQKMKLATTTAAENSEMFKSGTDKLAKQISDLNAVYGNMLNALS